MKKLFFSINLAVFMVSASFANTAHAGSKNIVMKIHEREYVCGEQPPEVGSREKAKALAHAALLARSGAQKAEYLDKLACEMANTTWMIYYHSHLGQARDLSLKNSLSAAQARIQLIWYSLK